MDNFVFFHVGTDLSQPTMLVNSIKRSNPSSRIFQCTDLNTPAIPGVSSVHRSSGDPNKLMIFRIDAFDALNLLEPALYLDTDMLVLKRISIEKILSTFEVMLCKRTFNLLGPFIGKQRGLDFREYDGMPLGEVYPYVACATMTKDHKFWHSLSNILKQLHPKFLEWYGDQEAMKAWATAEHRDKFSFLPEAVFGCLPEERALIKEAIILHFKGHHRKPVMEKFYDAIFGSGPGK